MPNFDKDLNVSLMFFVTGLTDRARPALKTNDPYHGVCESAHLAFPSRVWEWTNLITNLTINLD